MLKKRILFVFPVAVRQEYRYLRTLAKLALYIQRSLVQSDYVLYYRKT